MKINGIGIGQGFPPYVIAELSGNHNNSIEFVLELLQKCAKAGVSAFKLQTYSADSMTVNSASNEFVIKSGTWAGRNLYDLYSEGHTPTDWLPEIFAAAKTYGIDVFSTPFSPADVQTLENFNVPAYKIASLEITYTQLLREIASTGKPVIFSTGLATIDEISEAVEVLTASGASQIAILKCTTNYPAELSDLNLSSIPYLQKKFGVPVGFSDHTIGPEGGWMVAALGGVCIEKHYTLDKTLGLVPDHAISVDPPELSELVRACNRGALMRGNESTEYADSEGDARSNARRSLVSIEPIEIGTPFDLDLVVAKRPGIGIEPWRAESLVGKRFKRRVEADQTIFDEDLEK